MQIDGEKQSAHIEIIDITGDAPALAGIVCGSGKDYQRTASYFSLFVCEGCTSELICLYFRFCGCVHCPCLLQVNQQHQDALRVIDLVTGWATNGLLSVVLWTGLQRTTICWTCSMGVAAKKICTQAWIGGSPVMTSCANRSREIPDSNTRSSRSLISILPGKNISVMQSSSSCIYICAHVRVPIYSCVYIYICICVAAICTCARLYVLKSKWSG